MTPRASSADRHAAAVAAIQSIETLPAGPENPGDAFVRDEIESNRKKERWLLFYALISLALVAVLVIVRLWFFT